MGGSSWGYEGGLLGAVPLRRKAPGFGFWLVFAGSVGVGGRCAMWRGWFGLGVFCTVFYLPEIPFAMLSFGTVFIWDDFLGDGVFIY